MGETSAVATQGRWSLRRLEFGKPIRGEYTIHHTTVTTHIKRQELKCREAQLQRLVENLHAPSDDSVIREEEC